MDAIVCIHRDCLKYKHYNVAVFKQYARLQQEKNANKISNVMELILERPVRFLPRVLYSEINFL